MQTIDRLVEVCLLGIAASYWRGEGTWQGWGLLGIPVVVVVRQSGIADLLSDQSGGFNL